MRRDCPTTRKSQEMSKGKGKLTAKVASLVESLNNLRRMVGAHRPTTTQSSMQQPRAQDRVFALTQQDAKASSAMVEGMISFAGHTARVYSTLVPHIHLFVIHLHLNLINPLNL